MQRREIQQPGARRAPCTSCPSKKHAPKPRPRSAAAPKVPPALLARLVKKTKAEAPTTARRTTSAHLQRSLARRPRPASQPAVARPLGRVIRVKGAQVRAARQAPRATA